MERTLVTGWFSLLHGEATAGDILALHRVQAVLDRAGQPHDVAWSPGFRPGALSLADADPAAYTRLVFVCGPLHGQDIAWLHERFGHCLRVAVGTSVLDPRDPAVAGFHRILARDGAGPPTEDLAARAPARPAVPVAGLLLTGGQHEYGARRLHGRVAETVTGWLNDTRCAPVPFDTRLDARDGTLPGTPDELLSLLERLDVVVTDRLHGLVLALRVGVPAVAIDPVSAGAKMTAQARALRWPAVIPGERLDEERLGHWWTWALGPGARLARRRARELTAGHDPADALPAVLARAPAGGAQPAAGAGPSTRSR
ncbi:Polysaccharide pyruvyl transferase [Streptomyces zhaozhouensis]|uniref:Polysaccharide pyruvyl transferase n=1 Tax=Streptomyces zhaozhouensis TaxID=1300267 RepID=A0A286DU87_9ACTN|nr:polysaccharide pyruvyl transferase family protein [Streptomyces zhaozhouensis]SOD62235.1 Polysaccharide pyruvyl transferase [Streptomyces zhaozhouensis]